jgi:hypothetical protein
LSEVTDLLHRYAEAIDSRRLELLRDVFTPDASEDFRRLGTKVDGVDGIIAFIGKAIARWTATQHSITNIVSDGETCSCYFVAVHVKPEGGLFEVGGAYYDTLARTDDGLRIAERILEPIWER